jgi:hypothetical protein
MTPALTLVPFYDRDTAVSGLYFAISFCAFRDFPFLVYAPTFYDELEESFVKFPPVRAFW